MFITLLLSLYKCCIYTSCQTWGEYIFIYHQPLCIAQYLALLTAISSSQRTCGLPETAHTIRAIFTRTVCEDWDMSTVNCHVLWSCVSSHYSWPPYDCPTSFRTLTLESVPHCPLWFALYLSTIKTAFIFIGHFASWARKFYSKCQIFDLTELFAVYHLFTQRQKPFSPGDTSKCGSIMSSSLVSALTSICHFPMNFFCHSWSTIFIDCGLITPGAHHHGEHFQIFCRNKSMQ